MKYIKLKNLEEVSGQFHDYNHYEVDKIVHNPSIMQWTTNPPIPLEPALFGAELGYFFEDVYAHFVVIFQNDNGYDIYLLKDRHKNTLSVENDKISEFRNFTLKQLVSLMIDENLTIKNGISIVNRIAN